MFFRPGWKKFIPVIGVGILMSQTSTAIMAAFIGSGWYLFGWRGSCLAVIPSCIYYLFFKVQVHALSFGTRLEYWSDAIHKLYNSWQTVIFGVGPGVYWQVGNDLHSEYMNTLFNLGILGLALVVAYLVMSFKKACNRYLCAAFIVICVNAIGNHLMHTAPTAMLALIVMALRDRREVELCA
jgi:O-antigen ligase